MLDMEYTFHPFTRNIFRVEFHLGIFGKAFVTMVGIAAQNRTAFYYAWANGICNIGLPDPSKLGHTQIEAGLSVLCHNDRNLVIAYASLIRLTTPFPGISIFDLHPFFGPKEKCLVTFGNACKIVFT